MAHVPDILAYSRQLQGRLKAFAPMCVKGRTGTFTDKRGNKYRLLNGRRVAMGQDETKQTQGAAKEQPKDKNKTEQATTDEKPKPKDDANKPTRKDEREEGKEEAKGEAPAKENGELPTKPDGTPDHTVSLTSGNKRDWLHDMTHQSFKDNPHVLIEGGTGSGKSHIVRHIAMERMKAGHDVYVVDTHEPHKWGGAKDVFQGDDAAGEAAEYLRNELKTRKAELNKANKEGREADFKPTTVVFSDFARLMKDSPELQNEFRTILTEARKFKIAILADTTGMTGAETGVKGIENVRNNFGTKAKAHAPDGPKDESGKPTGPRKMELDGETYLTPQVSDYADKHDKGLIKDGSQHAIPEEAKHPERKQVEANPNAFQVKRHGDKYVATDHNGDVIGVHDSKAQAHGAMSKAKNKKEMEWASHEIKEMGKHLQKRNGYAKQTQSPSTPNDVAPNEWNAEGRQSLKPTKPTAPSGKTQTSTPADVVAHASKPNFKPFKVGNAKVEPHPQHKGRVRISWTDATGKQQVGHASPQALPKVLSAIKSGKIGELVGKPQPKPSAKPAPKKPRQPLQFGRRSFHDTYYRKMLASYVKGYVGKNVTDASGHTHGSDGKFVGQSPQDHLRSHVAAVITREGPVSFSRPKGRGIEITSPDDIRVEGGELQVRDGRGKKRDWVTLNEAEIGNLAKSSGMKEFTGGTTPSVASHAPAPKPIAKPATQAKPTSHTAESSWDTARSIINEVSTQNSRIGGLSPVADVTQHMKRNLPGLSGEQAEAMIRQWSDEGKIHHSGTHVKLSPEEKSRARSGTQLTASSVDEETRQKVYESIAPKIEQLRQSTHARVAHIADVVDHLRSEMPELSKDEVHDILRSLREDEKIHLDVNNDPRLDPRRDEAIDSPRGPLAFIRLTNKSMGKRTTKSIDASGHVHGSDGKFTSNASPDTKLAAAIAKLGDDTISIPELRSKFKLSKEEFDAAIFRLAEADQIFLLRDDRPGQLSKEELGTLVKHGDTYFRSVGSRMEPAEATDEPETPARQSSAEPPHAQVFDAIKDLGDETRSIPELREQLGLDKKAFDAAVFKLASEGKVFLIPNDRPGHSTEDELNAMVRHGDTYFCTIGLR